MTERLEVDSAHWRELNHPRVEPLSSEEMNVAARGISKAAGLVVGGGQPPNLFLTLARHPRMFATWLAFAAQLMPRGSLPRRDTELVILRVAWNCRCRYEWDHHVRLGRQAGLDDVTITCASVGPQAEGLNDRQRLLLAAADELHAERALSDATWAALAGHLDDKRLIELCMLIGHYEMLAMTITSLGIEPELALS